MAPPPGTGTPRAGPPAPADQDPLQDPLSTSRRGNRLGLGNLVRAFSDPKPGATEEPSDLAAMLKQRDLKIKSLDAMIHSYLRIIDKMKGDIERMDMENEEAKYVSS